MDKNGTEWNRMKAVQKPNDKREHSHSNWRSEIANWKTGRSAVAAEALLTVWEQTVTNGAAKHQTKLSRNPRLASAFHHQVIISNTHTESVLHQANQSTS